MTAFLSRKLAFGLLATALLAGTPALQAADAPPPVTLDAAFEPVAMAQQMFTLSDAAALKGMSRVAVPLFTVEFVTADSVSSSTSGFAAAGRATSSLYYQLTGVGEPDFQLLTDMLYADFIRDLKAGGLEVVAPAQVMASPTYAKLAASGKPAPLRSDSAITMAPAGMAVYGFSKAAAGGGGGGIFSALASMGSGLSAVGAALDTLELAKEMNAAVLEVQMRVNFVQLTAGNKGFLGRMAFTATTTGKLNPSISNTSMRVYTGAASSTLTMKNPLALDSAAFSEVREKASTAGDIAGAVAVGLLRLATGSGDSSSSSQMQAVADPAGYSRVVGEGLGAVREMLVLRLRAGQ